MNKLPIKFTDNSVSKIRFLQIFTPVANTIKPKIVLWVSFFTLNTKIRYDFNNLLKVHLFSSTQVSSNEQVDHEKLMFKVH